MGSVKIGRIGEERREEVTSDRKLIGRRMKVKKRLRQCLRVRCLESRINP